MTDWEPVPDRTEVHTEVDQCVLRIAVCLLTSSPPQLQMFPGGRNKQLKYTQGFLFLYLELLLNYSGLLCQKLLGICSETRDRFLWALH